MSEAIGGYQPIGDPVPVCWRRPTWPGPGQACVAELDPDGGVLGCRQAFSEEPGLITLAAGASHSPTFEFLDALRRLADGTPVLCAPPSPERTAA